MSRRRSRRGAEQRQRLFVLLGKRLVAGDVLALTAYYADEKIVLSAEEADDNAGRPPDAAPVGNPALKVHFAADGLRDADVVGALPLEYALQMQGVEYHFTVTTGSAKGWLEVAAEKCSFR
jgi:hypothetical protein